MRNFVSHVRLAKMAADGGEERIDIEDLLSAAERKVKERYKSTEVQKLIEPQLDIGNLLVVDQDPIEFSNFKKEKDVILKTLARDNTQFLFNAVWKLPIERCENIVVAKLPEPTTILPREKRVPKPKPLTKWQEFAKRKGINKTKKGRMIWDEASESWKPRWGFKRAKDQTKDWFIEIPDNADPYEDQFLKREHGKKERVAKNEYQRLKNIDRSQKPTKRSGLEPSEKPSRGQLKATINAARVSTASVGKFTPKLQHETIPKKTGKKRKFEAVAGDIKTEKQRNLDLLEKIGKRPTLDVNKAANQQMNREERETGREKKGKTNKRPKGGANKRPNGSNFKQGNMKQKQRKRK